MPVNVKVIYLPCLKITLSSLGLDIRLRGAVSMAFRTSLQDADLLEKMCAPVLNGKQASAPRSLDRGTGERAAVFLAAPHTDRS